MFLYHITPVRGPLRGKVILIHMNARSASGPVRKLSSSGTSKPYHHGDLRASLIAATREALDSVSPEDISLKALALTLGVSQPAPYRHFGGREALLTVVAIEGFREFSVVLAPKEGMSPNEDFEEACNAYLQFARNHKGLYRLMFASRILKDSNETELYAAAADSFTLLLDRVRKYSSPPDTEINAIWVWSTLHGLAMLDAEDLAAGPLAVPMASAKVVQRMVASFVEKNEPKLSNVQKWLSRKG